MRRISQRYASRIGLSVERYAVNQAIAPKIGAYQADQLVDTVLRVIDSGSPAGIDGRALRGRVFELERDTYSADLYDPGERSDGVDIFEVYRRGIAMEVTGNFAEAERMYSRVAKVAPEFTRAVRRYAGILRGRDSARAASLYSDALEYMPQLIYGALPNMDIVGIRRNFSLVRKGKEYFAIPAAIGEFDPAKPALTRRLRRFNGLLLMRLRLRARSITPQSASATTAAVASRAQTPSIMEQTSDRGTTKVPSWSAAAAMDLIWRKKHFVAAAISWLKSTARNWVIGNVHLFQFVLVAPSIDDLERQVDMVDDLWLSRGKRSP